MTAKKEKKKENFLIKIILILSQLSKYLEIGE